MRAKRINFMKGYNMIKIGKNNLSWLFLLIILFVYKRQSLYERIVFLILICVIVLGLVIAAALSIRGFNSASAGFEVTQCDSVWEKT